jgi:RecB family exonuclease
MNDPEPEFDWTVTPSRWAPLGRPKPPFGVTAVEIARSCPLRSYFEASDGYEPRTAFAARIGTAFHRAVQTLSTTSAAETIPEAASRATSTFTSELTAQTAQADSRPRERGLPRYPERADHALEAVIVEAQRASEAKARYSTAVDDALASEVQVSTGFGAEVPVRSADGLLVGRIDSVERAAGGVRIVDYKSALRVDLPERYERQVQLYAHMWRDSYGQWPTEAVVVYPLLGTASSVPVDPETCERVKRESLSVIEVLLSKRDPRLLATPGEVCSVCEYRPWCEPFWAHQAGAPNESAVLERAGVGFEGRVDEIDHRSGHVRLSLWWQGRTVTLVADSERFPQAGRAQVGSRVRALDWNIRGQRHQPQALATARSELFLVKDI